MIRNALKEDKRPQNLYVIFSKEIMRLLENVYAYNQNNINALSQLSDYLDGLRNYISNPVIAWDYTNKYSRYPNGTIYMNDFGYNVGYSIITDKATGLPCVYVFKINLNLEAFGLKMPPLKEENLISVTKSDFKNMVLESVGKILLTEKYYNPAIEPMVDRKLGDYDVLYGAYDERIICDIRQKGWVRDIIMYSTMAKGGKTYALYRRCDNGKYFFAEIMDLPEDKEHLHAKIISPKSIPQIIWIDAKRVISLLKYVISSN